MSQVILIISYFLTLVFDFASEIKTLTGGGTATPAGAGGDITPKLKIGSLGSCKS